jgi:hypothetical protein
MLWSFFGSGHGKGPDDGAGAMIKRFLHRKQLNTHARKLQNDEEVVEFLREWLSSRPKSSYYGSMKPLHKTFLHVKVGDVDRDSPLFICDPMNGIMKIHSICASTRII